MNTAIEAVDSFGSNILHLACYHGMDVHYLNYILDNCSLESRVAAVNSQDKAGNLPLFNVVESILQGKIGVRQGLEVVRRLYLINPKTIFHFNHENYTVSEFVYNQIQHMHTESEVFNQLKLLFKDIRRLMKQAYLLQKKEWEERAQRSAKVKETVASSTRDLTELETAASSTQDLTGLETAASSTQDLTGLETAAFSTLDLTGLEEFI